jgi:hypothetical protein
LFTADCIPVVAGACTAALGAAGTGTVVGGTGPLSPGAIGDIKGGIVVTPYVGPPCTRLDSWAILVLASSKKLLISSVELNFLRPAVAGSSGVYGMMTLPIPYSCDSVLELFEFRTRIPTMQEITATLIIEKINTLCLFFSILTLIVKYRKMFIGFD